MRRARDLLLLSRMDGIRSAAEAPAGIAGGRGEFTTFLLDAYFPALFCKCARESLGGQLDFPGIHFVLAGWGSRPRWKWTGWPITS